MMRPKFGMKTLLEAILLVGMAAGILMMLFFYRDLKEELYRWSDRSAANLADSIGARTREQLKYFDYLNLDKMLAEQMNLDDLLLYGAVEYGKDLGQKMEAGDESAGPSRVYVREIREGGITAARVTIHYSTSVIRRKLIALQWTMATGALITMAAFLGCIWLPLSHNVRKPLRRLAAHASAMASGDFSSEISVGSSGEESGQLAAALGRMAYHLREMVGKIRTIFTGLEKASVDIAGVAHAISVSSREQAESVSEVSASIMEMNSSIKSVAASVGSLHSISEGSFSSIQEMTASVEQVAGVSEQLSTAVEQTASSITQMSFSIQSVAANVETLSGLVTGLSSSLNEMDHSLKEVDQSAKEANRLSERVVQTVSLEGHEAVGKAMEGINAIQISVAEASRVIALLGKRSQDIGEIINVIKDVNEQTNLLALNAAIIAAQAGEHGRGFAVVASEIRELSARTSAATSEITGLITGVQDQAGKAVGAMEDGSRSVENGIRLIREVSIALKKAAENSEKASAASKVIARATTQQTESIRQLSGSASNMSQMSREMARATQEQSVGVAQVMHAAEEIRDLAFRVKKATTEQAAGIKQISLATEKSAVMAQEINRATREEAKGSELIVKSAGKIRDTASANLEVANRLEEMMSNLTEQANLLKRELDGFITEKGQDRKRI